MIPPSLCLLERDDSVAEANSKQRSFPKIIVPLALLDFPISRAWSVVTHVRSLGRRSLLYGARQWRQAPDTPVGIDKRGNAAVGKLQSWFVFLTEFGKYTKVTCPLLRSFSEGLRSADRRLAACRKHSGISSDCSSGKMIQMLQLWFLTHVMRFYWKPEMPVPDFPTHRNYMILIVYLYRVKKKENREHRLVIRSSHAPCL